jgi:putative DNA primase/helicase
MGFEAFSGTDFVPFIIPIIPKGSKLSPGTTLTPEKIGKVPGYRDHKGEWWGFKGWSETSSHEKSLPAWAAMFKADKRNEIVAVRSTEILGVDSDIDHAIGREIIERNALVFLGVAPKRIRAGTHKFLMVYRLKEGTPFVTKKRLAFTTGFGGDFALELLGKGQQFIIEGEHPSGDIQHYAEGDHPLEWGFDGLTQITGKQIAEFYEACRAELEESGFIMVKAGGANGPGSGTGDTTGDRYDIGENHPDQCPDFDLLVDWLKTCPNSAEQFANRDDWIRTLTAIKVSCAGDEGFYTEYVEPWNMTYAGNTPEYIRATWESIDEGALGWSYLCAVGQDFGWMGLVRSAFEELLVDDDHPAAPTPPPKGIGTNDDEVADAIVAKVARTQWMFTPAQTRREGKGWRSFKTGLWRDDDTLMETVGDACEAISKALIANPPPPAATPAATAKALQAHMAKAASFRSYTKIRDVTALVKVASALRVGRHGLDRDPLFLGVPGGYIDADGVLRPPDPSKLITRQALLAPDANCPCPRFMAQMDLICNGSLELVEAMQRLIGYTLSGLNNDQIFIFLHGEGGTGKTQFVKVIHDLMGDYATRAENTMFAKMRNDRRSFDLSAMEGYRLAFISEINIGMEWDEARLKEFTGGDGLLVEGKNRDHRALKTTPTCWFVGNRVPKFTEGGEALERRMVLFSLKQRFDNTARVLDFSQVLIKAEGPGIMAKLVRWRQDYLRHGLVIPDELLVNRRRYFDEGDKTISFLADECEFGAGHQVLKAETYERYKQWCHTTGHKSEGRNEFYHRLETNRMFRDQGATFGKKRIAGLEQPPQHVVIGMQLVPVERSTISFDQ